MKVSYPRLRRGRLKTGQSLEIIHGGAPEVVNSLREAADRTAELGPDMAGYVVLAWDFRGRTIRSWHVHARSPVQRSLLPSYFKDVLLKEITEEQVFENLESDE